MGIQREDDFSIRRRHLEHLSEKELEERFWELAYQVVNPLIEMAKTNTTPSIERSVLLRMGLDSLQAQAIVKETLAKGLLGHGAGHCVWRYSEMKKISLQDAARQLAEGSGWDELERFFGKGSNS